MKLSALVLGGVFLLIPASAHADGVDQETDRPVHLAAGFDVLSLRSSSISITRTRFTLSPEFTFGSRFLVAPLVRMSSTSFDLREQSNLPLDLSLTLPWEPSLGSRVEFRCPDVWRFRFTFRGEFEAPFAQNQVHIDSYTPKRELLAAPIDVDTLRNHVQVNHLWRTASSSLVLSAGIGPVRPYVEFGYMMIDSSLALSPDRKAQSVLEARKVRLDRFYQEGESSMFYNVGAHINFGNGFGARLGGAYVPYQDKRFLAGEATIVIPLDLF